MPELAPETRFMGAITAMTMHEMQNILAIIRESAGLMGDILKINARVDFKHRPNMERTLEHISTQIDRGKGLLDATSKLAHSPDPDMLESCDLAVYARTVSLLSGRMVRLRGAAVHFTPSSTPLPIAVGSMAVLMTGHEALRWLVGESSTGEMLMSLEPGTDSHALVIRPTQASQPDPSGLAAVQALLPEGRLDWDGQRLRILFPAQR